MSGGMHGVIRWDNHPCEPDLLAMQDALRSWGRHGRAIWQEHGVGLGCLALLTTDEATLDNLPAEDVDGRYVITATVRLDNRDTLMDTLGLHASERRVGDSHLIMRAYARWGDACVTRLIGDWAFALWDKRRRRLLLARDAVGNVGIYFHHAPHRGFAFASDVPALLARPAAPTAIDERHLAEYLAAWVGDMQRTFYKDITRVLNGHLVIVENGEVTTRRWWNLADAPDVRLGSDREYLDAFLHLFEEAVRCRLRSRAQIASTLSSGLDSGTVTALVARALARQGQRLTAFTSVPLYRDVQLRPGQRVDEGPAARVLARMYGNVTHVEVDCENTRPLQAIQHSLQTHGLPTWAGANAFWLQTIVEEAARRGADVLLTGQMGNLGVSYNGGSFTAYRALRTGRFRRFLRELAEVAHRRSWVRAVGAELVRPLLALATRTWRRLGIGNLPWPELAVIDAVFERRIGLRAAVARDVWPQDIGLMAPHDQLAHPIHHYTTVSGAQWHALGAANGLEVRDPTADVRLLTFCAGLPQEMFLRNGEPRWIIRQIGRELLPPVYLDGKLRGRQSADLARRLIAERARMEALLSAIRNSDASRYVNVPRLFKLWSDLQHQSGNADGFLAACTLLRGVQGALFLNARGVTEREYVR